MTSDNSNVPNINNINMVDTQAEDINCCQKNCNIENVEASNCNCLPPSTVTKDDHYQYSKTRKHNSHITDTEYVGGTASNEMQENEGIPHIDQVVCTSEDNICQAAAVAICDKTGDIIVNDADANDSGIQSDIKNGHLIESTCDTPGEFEMVHKTSEIVHYEDFYESVYDMSAKRKSPSSIIPERSKDEVNENRECAYSHSLFSCLPVELVIKIFSYLTTQQICRHCTPVCRKWKEIAMDPCLWHSIDFSHNPNLSSLDLLWVVRRAPHLRNLYLRGRIAITLAELAILTEYCTMLQEVNLGFCPELNNEMIACIADNCPHLCSINVEGCNKISSECVQSLVKCKKLHTINFSHCLINNEGVIHLARHLPKIISIDLEDISWIIDSGVVELVRYHSAHLLSVVLDGADVSDEGIKHLCLCKQLRNIVLYFCEALSDQALVYLKELEHLETLKLRKGTSFSTAGMLTFFQGAKLQRLTSLNVSECICVDDTVVLQMVQCCGRSLRELALQWCYSVSDRGLVAIVDHCSNLQRLELTGLHKIEGFCLLRLPEEIPKLTFLDLQQCDTIDDSLIMDVILEKPDLEVLNYYGERFCLQINCYYATATVVVGGI